VDHQSTVRDLVKLNANFTLNNYAHYQFDSYGKFFTGKENGSTISAPTLTRILFTGQEYDLRLKTYVHDYRIYDPLSGKFTKTDPLDLGPDTNPYRYVGNDPVNHTDPTGMDSIGTGTWGNHLDPGETAAWVVEDAGGWQQWNTPLGVLDDNGMIQLSAEWGGGSVSLAALNANAAANSLHGMTDAAAFAVMQQRINALKNGDTLVSDPPQTACQGFAEGWRRGSVVVNDALTLYQIESLHDEAERYIAQAQRDGDTLTEYAFYSGRVGAHSAQAAVGLHVLSAAGVTQVGTVPLSAIPSTGYVELTIAVNTGTMFPATASQGRNPPDVAVFATVPVRPTLPPFDGRTTHGVLVTNQGRVISLQSGNPNPAFANYPAAGHCEGQAAIWIRQNSSTGGVVYHNNPNGTCGFCHAQVPTLLPEGATLSVVPPAGAVPPPRWHINPNPYVGNSATPRPNPRQGGG
jgi:RHS repeat-associated protein